jgi:hypothetical protein
LDKNNAKKHKPFKYPNDSKLCVEAGGAFYPFGLEPEPELYQHDAAPQE